MLKIKLYPVGKRNQRKFRIVVAPERSKLDGKYIENLGFYDPISNPASLSINKVLYKHWLERGAQPTRTVRLLEKKA